MILTVEVGYTIRRPIVPDERTAWVMLVAHTRAEGACMAAQVVQASAPDCVMATRTTILEEES